MIPLDINEAHKAFNNAKINMWEITFITEVSREEQLTIEQYNKIIDIGRKMLPYKLIIKTNNSELCVYNDPIDPYFNTQYFNDEY